MTWLRLGFTHPAAHRLVTAFGLCLVLTTGLIMAVENEGKQVTLTDKDNKTKQKLPQGALLVVHLETQPGTGFGWVLAKSDKDQLTLLSSVLLDNPNMLPDGKSVQVFTFRATSGGTSELELHYKRPFGKEKQPAKTFKVTVTYEPEGKQVTLTDKDNNTKQKLSHGALLVLHLETQPGTGFSWSVAKSDKAQLTLLSSVLLDNPDKLPGGKAVQLLTFRGATAGTDELELHYKRPFDKDKQPLKTFKVTVKVDE